MQSDKIFGIIRRNGALKTGIGTEKCSIKSNPFLVCFLRIPILLYRVEAIES